MTTYPRTTRHASQYLEAQLRQQPEAQLAPTQQSPFLTSVLGYVLTARHRRRFVRVLLAPVVAVIFCAAVVVDAVALMAEQVTFRMVDRVMLRFAQAAILAASLLLACAVIEMLLSPIFQQVVR